MWPGRGAVPDDANIQLLLTMLPADSLARKLVAPFAAHPVDEAAKTAQRVLTAVKEARLKEDADGAAKAA